MLQQQNTEEREKYSEGFERRSAMFKRRMGRNRKFTGILLLLVGLVFFLQKMSDPFPHWLFSWPVILIIFGLFIGIRKKFRGPGWFILLVIGGVFLAGELYPDLHVQEYSGPILLIVAGLAFIFRPRHHPFGKGVGHWNEWHTRREEFKNDFQKLQHTAPGDDDYLDITSVMGGTKKIILSKDFKGGEVTSFLGGTELNLSQADITGRVTLELTQVLGGTKLIVPANWDIKPDLVSVFGSIEDKRQLPATIDPSKILVLKGTSVFGGIEIRSF